MYSITIEIPIHSTDANRILGVNRYAKHAIFERVKKEVAAAVSGKLPEKPLDQFLITVKRHSPGILDYDNLIGSLKAYIDGLVISGVIVNDDWEHIKEIAVGQVRSKEKKLVITVSQV